MHVNTRVRMCQHTAVWLRPALGHVEGNASWSSFIYKAVHKLLYHRGVRYCPCARSLSLAIALPVFYPLLCTLEKYAAQGLKHQFCLAHVLEKRTGKKTDVLLSHIPETSQPGILQFRFSGCFLFIKLKFSKSQRRNFLQNAIFYLAECAKC